MGEWRPSGEDEFIVCDPTLDIDILCLPAEVRHGIWAGKNYSNAQVERIKARIAAEQALAREAEKNRDINGSYQ